MSILAKRSEIDGLRAVAVLAVLFYHASLGFSGGFVGVDVFFVISGYLITSLITREISSNSFTLVGFWERRIRRIFPAAAVVIAACLLAGWFTLLPLDFYHLGRSAIAQSLLISNVFFCRSTGYDTKGDAIPLLHTWSLAVEEQFYLLFPLLLILLKRFARTKVLAVLTTLGILSFGICVYLTYYGSRTESFFLLQSRAWELILGSVLAVAPENIGRGKATREVLSWVGIGCILFAAIYYSEGTYFPGAAALLPCVGVGMIIWSNSMSKTRVGHLLSSPPMVFVGLISYSLYLWHWPLLTFARYEYPGAFPLWLRIAAVVVSFPVAILSWRFVENPIRQRRWPTRQTTVFVSAGLIAVFILSCGVAVSRGLGFRSRWSPEVLQFADGKLDQPSGDWTGLASVQRGDLIKLGRQSGIGSIDFVLWGDSHARSVLPVLDRMCCENRLCGAAATQPGEAPLLHFSDCSDFLFRKDEVPKLNQAVVDFVRTRQVKNVLLVAKWNGYVNGTFREKFGRTIREKFKESLLETVDALKSSGVHVFIMKDVAQQSDDIPRSLAKAAEFGIDPTAFGVPVKTFREETRFVNELLDSLRGSSVTVLDPSGIMTDGRGFTRNAIDGRALYCDSDHLSGFGAIQMRPMFAQMFEDMRKDSSVRKEYSLAGSAAE